MIHECKMKYPFHVSHVDTVYPVFPGLPYTDEVFSSWSPHQARGMQRPSWARHVRDSVRVFAPSFRDTYHVRLDLHVNILCFMSPEMTQVGFPSN